MHVLFYVDAGPQAGLGHLQRCLALASALRERGMPCCFLTASSPQVQRRLAALGFAAEPMTGVAEQFGVEQVLDVAHRQECEIVVVDSYQVRRNDLEILRAERMVVVAIDDLAREPFPCHLVINGGAHAQSLPYRSTTGETIFLLGARYALLRPEFWDFVPQSARPKAQQLLVTLGGTDRHDLMPRLLRSLDWLPDGAVATAVLGPFFHNQVEVERAAQECGKPVRLIQEPEQMDEFMRRADLTISAGGQTVYELARTGCPAVAISTAANQDGSLQACAEIGTLRFAGSADEPDMVDRVAAAAASLWSDDAARQAMSASARRLVDGQGPRRVAGVIQQHALHLGTRTTKEMLR